MGSVRVNPKGKLFFDFYFRKVRCREYTLLDDNKRNRQQMERMMQKIEMEIATGTFVYGRYFPSSNRVALFDGAVFEIETATRIDAPRSQARTGMQEPAVATSGIVPLFPDFANQWYAEKEVAWKHSQQQKVIDILNKHLIPRFRTKLMSEIDKTAVLAFRTYLARDYRDGKGLSAARINQILNILRQILVEASDRFGHPSPFLGIKPLRVPRTQVDPLSFDEVKVFLDAVPERYRNFYTVAFFTGMRTSELIGLKRRYVDFSRAEILIRETLVHGREETPKTDGSERAIRMSGVVGYALRDELSRGRADSELVFQNAGGGSLNYHNLARRVWYPTLEKAGLRRRKPYQTRHTAATLWLAAGENPEWVARQMGHTSTKMLFTVYSRYVPDLTRKDGSAIERILSSTFGTSMQGG